MAPRKRRPLRLASFFLLGTCAVAIVLFGLLAAPHVDDCASLCTSTCAREPAGMNKVLCESKCRMQCLVTRSRASARELPTQRPESVRVGGRDIAVPELNLPVEQLARAAAQLQAPLASPLESNRNRVDLRPELASRGVAIADQGETSTCMAHALTSAMEFELVPTLRAAPATAKRFGAPLRGLELSRKHAHSVSLHAAVVCSRQSPRGSWVLNAASAIAAEGTFLEARWPWAPWDPTSKRWASCGEAVNGGAPSSKALAARNFFIESFRYLPPFGLPTYASARNVSNLEGILDHGHPVVLSTFLFEKAFDAAWKNGGRVPMPSPGAKVPSSVHYVLLVGFDRSKEHFTFANSWGRGFGAAGFGTLPYAYVNKFAIDGLYVEKMAVKAGAK